MTASEIFNVILVYEDQPGARRGLALYQRLMNELGVGCEFNLHVWKFAVLGLARLDEISPEQAAAADLVIVCTRDESAPPEQIRAWYQHWVDMKGHDDCALVVLGEPAHDAPEPARSGGGCHQLTKRGGVAVFPPASAGGRSGARADGRAWFGHRQIACAWPPADDFSTTTTARSRA